MASVLDIAVDAAIEISLSEPATLMGTGAKSGGKKLLRYLTRTCRELAIRHPWAIITEEHTFTTTAAEIQTGSLPSDFRKILTETIWNRTTRRELDGPLTAKEYQSEKANVNGGIRDQFYIRGTNMLIYPAPAAGDTIAYEYIKNTIGTDSAGTTERTAFTDDTDIPYFDEELLILGTVWRYKKADGLDYSEEFNEYERRLIELKGDDGGGRRRIGEGGGQAGKARKITPSFEEYVD